MAQVHRFGDEVAVWLGDGKTIYLTPKAANAIADAMHQCTNDISCNKFTNSAFGTVNVDVTEGG